MTKTDRLQIRIDPKLRKKASKVAKAERRSFSDWTRLLIEREVKAFDAMQAQYNPPASVEQEVSQQVPAGLPRPRTPTPGRTSSPSSGPCWPTGARGTKPASGSRARYGSSFRWRPAPAGGSSGCGWS